MFKTLVYKLADHFCEHLCNVEKKNYTDTSKPGACHFNFSNHFIHNMTFSFVILLRWKFVAYQLLCWTNLLATSPAFGFHGMDPETHPMHLTLFEKDLH